MLHALFTHKNTHTMTFYYYLKPKHENKKHAMFVCVCLCVCVCVCVCNQRNAKVVAMVVFFQQCTYSIHGLHFFLVLLGCLSLTFKLHMVSSFRFKTLKYMCTVVTHFTWFYDNHIFFFTCSSYSSRLMHIL